MNTYKILHQFNDGLFTDLIEVWKDIENYEGAYQISSLGRVKSLTRTRLSKGISIARISGRDMKQKTSKCGYKVIGFCSDAVKEHFSVHRLVAIAFISNPENKPTVNHIDGNKENNKVSNLEWATQTEQMVHASVNDLLETRGPPKYSKKLKQEIQDYYNNNEISISKLAIMFGMSERTAGRIVVEVAPRPTTRIKKDGTRVVEPILTQEQVTEIKKLRAEGWTLIRLSEKFNRGLSQMHRVVNNMSRNSLIE